MSLRSIVPCIYAGPALIMEYIGASTALADKSLDSVVALRTFERVVGAGAQ